MPDPRRPKTGAESWETSLGSFRFVWELRPGCRVRYHLRFNSQYAIYKIPSKKWSWKLFLQTPAVCSRLARTLVGYMGMGEKKKRQERVKTGIRNFLKGSHLISWLTWLWLSPGWEWNVWCLGTRLILVTNLHLSFPLDKLSLLLNKIGGGVDITTVEMGRRGKKDFHLLETLVET